MLNLCFHFVTIHFIRIIATNSIWPMRICWEQLLFSSQTKYETVLLYQPLSVHPVLLCSLLLTQHLQENQHLKNRELHPLVVAAVGISSRPKPFLLPTDSQSSGLALLNSHFVALCFISTLNGFMSSPSLPTVRFLLRWRQQLCATVEHPWTHWRWQCQFTTNSNGDAARWQWSYLCRCQLKQPQHL